MDQNFGKQRKKRLVFIRWIQNMLQGYDYFLVISKISFAEIVNPLDARRRYTDFAQTSIRAGLRYTVRMACYRTRRQMVYLRYGV